MHFLDLEIIASREGDRVRGSVEFPYEVFGRRSVPIDYHSRRPDAGGSNGRVHLDAPSPDAGGNAANLRGEHPSPHSPSSLHRSVASSLPSSRSAARLSLARRYLQLCEENPDVPRYKLADRVAAGAPGKASRSSVREWARKLETEGPEALEDHYTPAPRKRGDFSPDEATAAIQLCAWWAFRIGNADAIDTLMMQQAVTLVRAGYPLADLVAAVDCYYAWPCDRQRYPFKTFKRWARYDVETWILRTAEHADRLRAISTARGIERSSAAARATPNVAHATPNVAGRVHLDAPSSAPGGTAAHLRGEEPSPHSVPCSPPSSGSAANLPGKRPLPVSPPPPKARRRDANHGRHRAALRRLAEQAAQQPGANYSADYSKTAAHLPGKDPLPDIPSSLRRSVASSLRSIGLPEAERAVLATIPVAGPAPLASVTEPATMAEALGRMPDAMRRTLLSAGRGDKVAVDEALATMPLWWDQLPRSVRSNIEFRSNAWRDDHPGVTDDQVDRRKWMMLRRHLRPHKSGVQKLAVAMRL